jgi:hypothetical protein
MTDRVARVVLRTLAVIIAIAAFIDPSVNSLRSTRPEVVVLSDNAGDSIFSAAVSRELSRDFTVLHKPFSNAAATVVVGARVPANGERTRRIISPVIAIVPERRDAHVVLASLRAPERAGLNARVPVRTTVDASNAKGKTIEVQLLANGAVVDRVTRVVATDNAILEMPLSFVPTAVGMMSLHVNARIAASPIGSGGDWNVDVTDRKWTVLFFDPRPSWMSTFVRRALERDTRFIVTSRTVTSTNVSTDAGRPPASLGDAMALEAFDAIVVGAPDALTQHDVDGLSAYLRRRGGGLALLFDEKNDGRYAMLTGNGGWVGASNATPTVIGGDNTDSVAMRASEWMWPARIPAGATVLAWNSTANARQHPIVWETSVGAGRLLVSGALDAWKFRDPAQSGFERFWQASIGELADGSSPPVELKVPAQPVAPGSVVRISLVSRNAALASLSSARPVQSAASASVRVGNTSEFVRVWPDGAAGSFTGSFRAPDSAGVYPVSATVDGATAEAFFIVSAKAGIAAAAEDTNALSAWAVAEGGRLLHGDQLGDLPASLSKVISPSLRRVSWHPMRSPWWLAPFVIALGAEWWLRRRRGLL